MSRYDVLVLGGGIIGAAVADRLARRGQAVCLVERGTIGCEASSAAAGILSAQMDLQEPGPFFDLCQSSRRMYADWVRHLERHSPFEVGYRQVGILYVAMNKLEAQRMERRMRWQLQRGFRVEYWSAREVTRREPHVRGRIAAGFFFPTEPQLDNVKLMHALARTCRQGGATLLEQTEVKRLLIRRHSIIGVATARRTLRAPIVINCLGSWAPLSQSSMPRLPVVPAKGQMLAFEAPRGFFRRAVMSDRAYGVQRRDGQLIVGSTVEFVGYDKRVTLDALHAILAGFAEMVPEDALRRCALRTFWAGLRPCTPDRLPILGATPIHGLYVATGHFRHGILLAPITACVIAELITTGRSPIDLSPFSLSRFRR